MLTKPFKDCVGKKLICPDCYTDLLNGNINVTESLIAEQKSSIKVSDGEFIDQQYYDLEIIEGRYEEYYCMACGYELNQFFKYLKCIPNTSEKPFSDEVITFISELYNII